MNVTPINQTNQNNKSFGINFSEAVKNSLKLNSKHVTPEARQYLEVLKQMPHDITVDQLDVTPMSTEFMSVFEKLQRKIFPKSTMTRTVTFVDNEGTKVYLSDEGLKKGSLSIFIKAIGEKMDNVLESLRAQKLIDAESSKKKALAEKQKQEINGFIDSL